VAFGGKKYFPYHRAWDSSSGVSSAKHLPDLKSVRLLCEAHEQWVESVSALGLP